MENNIAKSLLDKYTSGNCTAEECAAVEAWYAQWNQELPSIEEDRLQMALERINSRLPKKDKQVLSIGWRAWAAAAAVLMVASFGIWIYMSHYDFSSSTVPANAIKHNDVDPGGNKATLTLANGKNIILSDAKSGVVIDINKLSYDDGSSLSTAENIQKLTTEDLTISTPRGGTYKVVLPDGTKVWLNASSGIKFPSSFIAKADRTVKLMGEAYFEVEKDKSKPFIVETDRQKIEVLGTHFNVNSYSDEHSTITTLLEGSIQLEAGGQKIILRPEQQAIFGGKKLEISPVDSKEIIAWKNGIFIFNDEDLESIMRKVSRWYNVDVYYQDKLPKMSFLGSFSRSKSLSALLKVIEQSNQVHFRIEGRRITVMQ